MEFYNNEEVCFQQIKRTAKMMIGQEDIDNIKRIDIPDFDDEGSEIIKELYKKLLKRSMKGCTYSTHEISAWNKAVRGEHFDKIKPLQ